MDSIGSISNLDSSERPLKLTYRTHSISLKVLRRHRERLGNALSPLHSFHSVLERQRIMLVGRGGGNMCEGSYERHDDDAERR